MDALTLIMNAILLCIVAFGGPLIATWGVSTVHRCTGAAGQGFARSLTFAMFAWLFIGVLSGPVLGIVAVLTNLLVVAVVELLMRTGAISTVRDYKGAFNNLPFDIKIVNNDAREIYCTDISAPLDEKVLKQLVASAPPEGDVGAVTKMRLDELPETPFRILRLQAGIAILAEDTRELNEQTRRLESIRDDLTRQNEIIRHDRDVKRLMYRRRRERELSERVSNDLADTMKEIDTLLDTLPPLSDEESADSRLEQLNHVKTLVAYSKRKGMLALEAFESESVSAQEYDLIAREACADLRSIGIEGAVLVDTPEDIPVWIVSGLYDCFYDCVIAALPFGQAVFMTYITLQDDGAVVMRTSIECSLDQGEGDASDLVPELSVSVGECRSVQDEVVDVLRARLDARDVEYDIESEDDLVVVRVCVNEGGEFS